MRGPSTDFPPLGHSKKQQFKRYLDSMERKFFFLILEFLPNMQGTAGALSKIRDTGESYCLSPLMTLLSSCPQVALNTVCPGTTLSLHPIQLQPLFQGDTGQSATPWGLLWPGPTPALAVPTSGLGAACSRTSLCLCPLQPTKDISHCLCMSCSHTRPCLQDLEGSCFA